jgi:RimJ/RimL family protein N-acetyltransferase
MKIVPAGENSELVAEYLASHIRGSGFKPGSYQALAFLTDKDEFVGGVVVSNFREADYGNDCEMSVAAENPMAFRPHVMRALFHYVFVQLKCVRATAVTTKRNERSRALLTGMGFVLEGNVRRGYDGKRDALIYGLLAEDCRYLAGGLDGEK